jgi:hypothetical protein
LAASRWCPDSRHIVNTNEFNVRSPRPPKAQRFSRPVPRQVRMTLWSLTSRSVAYVPHPKACDVSFTPDGAFLAVLERKVSNLNPVQNQKNRFSHSALYLIDFPALPCTSSRTPSTFCPCSAMLQAGCSPSERSCRRVTAAAARGRPTAP